MHEALLIMYLAREASIIYARAVLTSKLSELRARIFILGNAFGDLVIYYQIFYEVSSSQGFI